MVWAVMMQGERGVVVRRMIRSRRVLIGTVGVCLLLVSLSCARDTAKSPPPEATRVARGGSLEPGFAPTPPARVAALTDPSRPLDDRVRMLVNKLGSTTPVTEQSVAENQLVKLGQSAVPLLNAHLRDDRRTYARIRIAFILGRLKDESSLPALVEAAGSEYVALQRAAVRSIVAIGGPRAKQSLMTLRKAARSPELSKEIDDALAKWQA